MWVSVYTFVLCEPGARMTNQFVLFSEELSRCNWYSLPIKMQQMYMIFLSDTQNPMKILSYANITCERDTTKKVCALQSIQTVKFTHFNCSSLDYQQCVFIFYDDSTPPDLDNYRSQRKSLLNTQNTCEWKTKKNFLLKCLSCFTRHPLRVNIKLSNNIFAVGLSFQRVNESSNLYFY